MKKLQYKVECYKIDDSGKEELFLISPCPDLCTCDYRIIYFIKHFNFISKIKIVDNKGLVISNYNLIDYDFETLPF